MLFNCEYRAVSFGFGKMRILCGKFLVPVLHFRESICVMLECKKFPISLHKSLGAPLTGYVCVEVFYGIWYNL